VNRVQRSVLVVMALTFTAIFVYPPFVAEGGDWHGYGWLLESPSPHDRPWIYFDAAIDVPRIFVAVVGVFLIGGAIILSVSTQNTREYKQRASAECSSVQAAPPDSSSGLELAAGAPPSARLGVPAGSDRDERSLETENTERFCPNCGHPRSSSS
jgi:hypothetical protein